VGHAEFAAADDGMIITRPVDSHMVLSIIDVAIGDIHDLDPHGVEPSARAWPRPRDGEGP
jgi:hypothetical protein